MQFNLFNVFFFIFSPRNKNRSGNLFYVILTDVQQLCIPEVFAIIIHTSAFF